VSRNRFELPGRVALVSGQVIAVDGGFLAGSDWS
jgi:hypothetical protein